MLREVKSMAASYNFSVSRFEYRDKKQDCLNIFRLNYERI